MDLSSRLLLECVLCIGRFSLAVRSLERIINVIPKQKLNTVYFQMRNPWIVCQKKSVVQQYWELCLCWQPSLCLPPLCCASPFLYPSFSCMLWGITFRHQYFLKGMGYLRCRLYMWRPDSPGNGPSWAGCDRAPLMAGLTCAPKMLSYRGQQESLGYCRVFHLRKFVQGTDMWLSCGRASWSRWEVQSAHALFYFSIFY